MAFAFMQMVPSPSPGTWIVYWIKEFLKSQGWTVPESSDGTTYNAAGDQITGGGAGAGGLGNLNAWIRLASPGGLPELTIQRNLNDSQFRVKIGRAAFAAGAPSATQTPATAVATDEIIIKGAGTDAAPTGATWFGGNSGQVDLKGGADDAAPYGFWFATSDIAGDSGTTLETFILDPLTATIPGDAFLYVAYAKDGELSNATLSIDAPLNVFTYLAAVAPATSINPSVTQLTNGTALAAPAETISTDAGRFREFPLRYERRAAVANPGYKGCSSILRWIAPIPRRWTPMSVNGRLDRISFGSVTLPWSSTIAYPLM